MSLFVLAVCVTNVAKCCEFGLYDAFDTSGTATNNGWKVLTLSDLSTGYFDQFINYMASNNHKIQAIASWTPVRCGVRSGGDIQGINVNGNGYMDVDTDKVQIKKKHI